MQKTQAETTKKQQQIRKHTAVKHNDETTDKHIKTRESHTHNGNNKTKTNQNKQKKRTKINNNNNTKLTHFLNKKQYILSTWSNNHK